MGKKLIHSLLGISMLFSTGMVHSADEIHGEILSHERKAPSLIFAINDIIDKIINRGDLPHVSVEKQLKIVDLLVDFGMGRFLLERGGLNGYWIDYAVKHPQKGRIIGLNEENRLFNGVEDFILNSAPVILATQQRFEIFKAETQKRLQGGMALASIPCGLMGNFLDLDFANAPGVSLTGIDLDPESILLAKEYAKQKGLDTQCTFSQGNAWGINSSSTYDLIASNGLTIYQPNDDKVTELYRVFFEALKPGGTLITSFLTPPPESESPTEWDLDEVDMVDALWEKVILYDVLDCKWQTFRPEEKVRSQLKSAGFDTIEIVYDNAHIFPTVIAKKPL